MKLKELEKEIRKHFDENELKIIYEKMLDTGACCVTVRMADYRRFNIIWLECIKRFVVVNCQNKIDLRFVDFESTVEEIAKQVFISNRCAPHIIG